MLDSNYLTSQFIIFFFYKKQSMINCKMVVMRLLQMYAISCNVHKM